ncbi:MAG: type 1 glutamine amidotransferase [Candidatus Omnitrophica bacterium]|nr:type 1 glutamine amidotransferase [Candidatus Omnitrophota bacterium]
MEMFLKKRNIPFEIVDLYQENLLPTDRSRLGAIIVLGGPMNVDDENRFPYLIEEKSFIRRCVEDSVPVLGICLGAQLLARVFDAQVYKNQHSELGCMDVELTKEGMKNPLFDQISSPMTVFQWHGDTFDLPKGADLLAQSPACLHQAFSVNNRFYGLQFHIEAGWEDAQRWAAAYLPDLQGAERKAAQAVLEIRRQEWSDSIQRDGWQLFENFFVSIAGFNKRT